MKSTEQDQVLAKLKWPLCELVAALQGKHPLVLLAESKLTVFEEPISQGLQFAHPFFITDLLRLLWDQFPAAAETQRMLL